MHYSLKDSLQRTILKIILKKTVTVNLGCYGVRITDSHLPKIFIWVPCQQEVNQNEEVNILANVTASLWHIITHHELG